MHNIELTIERLVSGGAGMASHEGRKVFVPFTIPGERVRAHFVLQKRDYAIAELDEVIEPASVRREPRCRYFGHCGGCQLQHIEYEEQLRVKAEIVLDALRRIGRIETRVEPTIPSPIEWHYRNKTQYAVGGSYRKGPVVGYFRPGTHRIITAESCPLHPPVFDTARRALADWLATAPDEAYNERNHTGNIRHLILRTDGSEVIAVVAARTDRIPSGLTERLKDEAGIDAVARTFNPGRNNRVFGADTVPVSGEPVLEFQIGDNRLRVSPSAFFQVNTSQACNLVNLVREELTDRRWASITDLYCGVGAITLGVADLAVRVVGVELDPVAVADAELNVRQNGISNIEFQTGDVEDFSFPTDSDTAEDKEESSQNAKPMDRMEDGKASAVIIDPPRKGVSEELLSRITSGAPARIVYVSCDPATLARDLARLASAGYRLTKVQPVDMFPQTAHIETVATLDPAEN